jgi:hypothetical protein
MKTNQFKTVLLSLFVIMLLQACSVFKPKTIVEKVEISKSVATIIPEELTRDCIRPEPFSKELYLKSSVSDKEDMLIKLGIEQYNASELCNRRLKVLRDWIKEQKAILK